MIVVTCSGNLVSPPKPAYRAAGGKQMLGIRFGSNTNIWDSKSKTSTKHVVWCTGLIAEDKIESILPYLKQGTYVVCHSHDAIIKTYEHNGAMQATMDLRWIQKLEAGNLDRGENAAPAPAPQPKRPQYAQQQYAQPQYAQPSMPQQPEGFDQSFGANSPF